jgi:hypothetical protein
LPQSLRVPPELLELELPPELLELPPELLELPPELLELPPELLELPPELLELPPELLELVVGAGSSEQATAARAMEGTRARRKRFMGQSVAGVPLAGQAKKGSLGRIFVATSAACASLRCSSRT